MEVRGVLAAAAVAAEGRPVPSVVETEAVEVLEVVEVEEALASFLHLGPAALEGSEVETAAGEVLPPGFPFQVPAGAEEGLVAACLLKVAR